MTSSKTRRRVHAGTALSLAVAAAISAAPAWAEPVQPGTDPGQSGPEQGGTTPSSPEQPGTTTPPSPAPPSNYNPGPGLVPSPPQGQWTPSQPETTSPPEIYSPVPVAPIHTPRATPPVKRIAPPPDHIRVGNFTMPVKDLPDLPMKNRERDKTVVSVNEWAAYTESEITRFLISIGVPEDKASRQAAAAMIGIAAGGGIGFAAGFTATAILVGPVAIPVATGIGCGVGMSMGGLPQTTLAGCGIGLASGVGVTLAAATAVGTATGASGAVLGGILAWALGALTAAWLTRVLGGGTLAPLLAATWCLFHPYALAAGRSAQPDVPMVALLLLGAACLARGRDDPDARWTWRAAAALGTAVLVNKQVLVVLSYLYSDLLPPNLQLDLGKVLGSVKDEFADSPVEQAKGKKKKKGKKRR